MSIVPVESERFKNMERVADLRMHGEKPMAISKQLGIPFSQVKELWEEYKDALSNDAEARDYARDYLYQMVEHYDSLIKKFYELLDDLESLKFGHMVAGQRNAALKAIAELERQRLDALQKAGLLDSTELGDELAAAEEKQNIIIDILSKELCPVCKNKIGPQLLKLTGQVQEIVVYEQ